MKKNILFCGTPIFANATLQVLFQCQEELNYNLVGVVTIKDKIAGRGQKIKESTIKKTAKKLNLPIFTPDNLEDSNFITQIINLNLDLIIVVAFKKLPSIFFNIPLLGTINLHASLLPKYRGAAPINWAIINGEKQSGLTTFFINEKIDTGDIIVQSKIDIEENWHVNDLHDKLMLQSGKIIKNTIQKVFNNNYSVKKQSKTPNPAHQYARKILKQDYQLNSKVWKQKSLKHLFNFIRGMSPPGVKTTIQIHRDQIINKKMIITRVGNFKTYTNKSQKNPVFIYSANPDELIVSNDIESFNIEKLKIENKQEMSAREFYNGYIKNKHQNYKISILI
ncbi:MAG: methionyl-tRNA formyltransferase [Flavobacteriales bacterium]|nr:methionyl-tRNA formyltransferase [Flavobacteriales bacterium]